MVASDGQFPGLRSHMPWSVEVTDAVSLTVPGKSGPDMIDIIDGLGRTGETYLRLFENDCTKLQLFGFWSMIWRWIVILVSVAYTLNHMLNLSSR